MNSLIFTLYNRGVIWNAIRTLLGTFDAVVYTIFGWAMRLMFDIVTVTTSNDLTVYYNGFQTRLYVVMSVFMLFKMVISLLSYIVSPDTITDKNQGAGKLVMRIILSLIMLIAFPIGFKEAMELQAHIIENGTVQKVILGNTDANKLPNMADEIALDTYNGVVISDSETGGKVTLGGELSDGENMTVETLIDHINDPITGREHEYKYNYMPVVGLLIGGFLAIVTVSMCIDVATRVFKLIILQVIAPIPIISYIDPKQSKDGTLSKWFKMLVSTWLEVFIRLAVIYFIVLMVTGLIHGMEDVQANVLVKIALIIALFFFAKEAPKFICDALGIKMPESGLFGGLGKIMAAGALGAGIASGAITGFKSSRLADTANENGHGFLNTAKNIGAGLFGGGTGAIAGMGAALGAKDHNARAVMEAMNKRKTLALSRGTAGSTLGGRLIAGAQSTFGLNTAFDRIDAKVQDYESAENAWQRISAAMNSDDDKFHSFASDYTTASGEKLIDSTKTYSTKGMNDLLERMKNSGQYTQKEIEDIDTKLKEVQKAKFDKVRSTSDTSTLSTTESQIYSGAETIFDVGSKYANDGDGIFADFGGKSLDDPGLAMGKHFKGASYGAKREADKIKNSVSYRKSKADKNEAQKK